MDRGCKDGSGSGPPRRSPRSTCTLPPTTTAILDTAARLFEKTAARTPAGTIAPHPPALETWVDVAYFTAPAAARLARLSGDGAMAEWSVSQLLAHQRRLLDDASGLFWHVGYAEPGRHSPCLWARGNSWIAIAATQVLDDLEASAGHPGPDSRTVHDQARAIRAAMVRQLNAIARLQDASGLWHTVIDRSDSYLEASATAGFALAFGRAIRTAPAGLDLALARRVYGLALEALCAKVNSRGEFTGVSQQTPPGEFNFYNSIELGTAPFGTGVCLMALSEAQNS
jgi:unsaturated rhamnogalacturonyl hydrolase